MSSSAQQIKTPTKPAGNALSEEQLAPLDVWATPWQYPALREDLDVKISRRLTSSLGLCRPARAQIRLNAELLAPERAHLLTETLAHEAAHFVVYQHFGTAVKPHGVEWQTVMRAAGFKPRARIPAEDIDWEPKRRASYIYEHACTTCGQVIVARRTSRHWRCRDCHDAGLEGRLVLIVKRPV